MRYTSAQILGSGIHQESTKQESKDFKDSMIFAIARDRLEKKHGRTFVNYYDYKAYKASLLEDQLDEISDNAMQDSKDAFNRHKKMRAEKQAKKRALKTERCTVLCSY